MGTYYEFSNYDSIIETTICIKFSNKIELKSGALIYEYIARDLFKNSSINLKEYVLREDKSIEPLENNIFYRLKGVLRREIYKSKKSGEYVDKGLYIDFTGRKDLDVYKDIQIIENLLKWENSYQNKRYIGGTLDK